MLHEETDRIAAAAAAKTFVDLLGGGDGKGRTLFIMERAEAKVVGTTFFELDKTADDLNNIDSAEDLLNSLLRYHFSANLILISGGITVNSAQNRVVLSIINTLFFRFNSKPPSFENRLLFRTLFRHFEHGHRPLFRPLYISGLEKDTTSEHLLGVGHILAFERAGQPACAANRRRQSWSAKSS
jgi:hypothetical protein